MSDSTQAATHRASCATCAKTYRVPSAERSYRCPGCGGELRASAPGKDCPRCGAQNDADAGFCASCGVALDGQGRRDAAAELSRAYRSVRRVRSFYLVLASLGGVRLALLLLVGLPALSVTEERGTVVLFLLLAAMLETFYVLGALRITREAFLWALLLACISTVDVLLNLLNGQLPIFSVLMCVLTYAALPAVVRVRELVRMYPDLYVSRRLRGEARRAVAGGPSVRGRARDRHRSERRRDLRRKLAVAGGIAAFAAAAGGIRYLATRPQDLSDALEDFRGAWEAGGASGALRLAAAEERDSMRAGLDGTRALRGDALDLTLGAVAPEIERNGPHAVATWASAAGPLHTEWRLEDRDWTLTAIVTPPGDLPERLLEAWNAGSIPRVAAFGADAERWRASLTRLCERREWSELPALRDPRVEAFATRVEVHAPSEVGPFRLVLRFAEHRWALTSLKPPSDDD